MLEDNNIDAEAEISKMAAARFQQNLDNLILTGTYMTMNTPVIKDQIFFETYDSGKIKTRYDRDYWGNIIYKKQFRKNGTIIIEEYFSSDVLSRNEGPAVIIYDENNIPIIWEYYIAGKRKEVSKEDDKFYKKFNIERNLKLLNKE